MNNKEFFTDSPVHPGEHLRETIELLGISQTKLANRIGLSRKVINEIISGKAPITPKTSILLERVIKTPAHVWNNLQRNYDLNIAYILEQKKLEKDSHLLSNFPITKMVRYGWIPKRNNKIEKVKSLYNFFGIGSLNNFEHSLAINFRRSSRINISKEAVFAWLRKGELEVQLITTKSYNKNGLKKCLQKLRSLTKTDPKIFQPEIIKLCSEVGVAVAFIPELPKVCVNGATFWVNNQKAAVLLSLRYKRNDQLWFSFFHEIGHILLHNKRESFVELDDDNLSEDEQRKEKDANEFAANLLIPPREWDVIKYNMPFSRQKVLSFAENLDIAPGIIVGRLQREGFIPFTHLNGLKEKYEWVLN